MTLQVRFPPGLDAARFLQRYWQRQPLLAPGALAGYDFPLTPEALAGLACEEEVESRVVIGHDRRHWSLYHGPFDEAFFAGLPETGWTLLVQDVDKWIPGVARLLEAFDFLPRWRFDDVMISYAAPGGSVGPHIDSYDVFLVQGPGRRRWSLQSRPEARALLPDLPLRILERFEPDQEWQVSRGDLLYLPPGVAHWGVAEEACMTWSVGLRAPSEAEMLDSFAQYLLERLPEERQYRDPPLTPAVNPGRITAGAVRQALPELTAWCSNEVLRARWFGCFVTELKPHQVIEPPSRPLTPEQVRRRLVQGDRLQRHPMARLAWWSGGGERWLFVCGEAQAAPLPDAVLETLCSGEHLDASTLAGVFHPAEGATLLAELVNRGVLEWADG